MAKWYKGKVGDMLRASGYKPLPRMWVTQEQFDTILAMCRENENHINAVRRYCRELKEKDQCD